MCPSSCPIANDGYSNGSRQLTIAPESQSSVLKDRNLREVGALSRVLSRIDRRELLRFSLLQIEMHRGGSLPCRLVCARTSAHGAESICERPRRMPASTRPHWLLVLVRGFELFRLAKGHEAPSALRRSHPQSRLAKGARQAGQRQREQRLRNLCLDRDSPL